MSFTELKSRCQQDDMPSQALEENLFPSLFQLAEADCIEHGPLIAASIISSS